MAGFEDFGNQGKKEVIVADLDNVNLTKNVQALFTAREKHVLEAVVGRRGQSRFVRKVVLAELKKLGKI